MPFLCTICTGSLEKNPPDDPAALPGAACLPCGHVFHQFCIDKWLASGSEKVCPMCRNVVLEKSLSLFHDFEEPSVWLYPTVPTSDMKAAEEREAKLQEKLSAALKEKASLKNKLSAALNEKATLKTKLQTVQDKNAALRNKLERALDEKIAVSNDLSEAIETSRHFQIKCLEHNLEKRIQSLERAAEKPTSLNVTTLPKTKPSATVTSKNSSATPPVVPAISRIKNVTMKAVPVDSPKPKPPTASTKTSSVRKTGAQTSA